MLHSSRVFVIYLSTYLILIALCSYFGNPQIDFVYVFPLAILALFVWRVTIIRYPLLMAALFLFVFAQMTAISRLPQPLIGQAHKGVIVAEPKLTNNNQLLVIKISDQTRVSVFVPSYPEYQIGDAVLVESELALASDDKYYQENPGYYLTRGIDRVGKDALVTKTSEAHSTTEDLLLNIRRRLVGTRKAYERVLESTMPEPYSGIAIGILLGTKSAVPDNIYNLFVSIGIIHIMALSGYNITIISDNIRRFTGQFSARSSFYFALSGVWLFVTATGFSASVVRAAIMGSLLLIARRLGRQADAFIAILLAATLMVALNPYILVYDVGFQLSFAAMAGLIFLAPRIMKFFEPLGRGIAGILGATLAAQIFTLPLLCYYFGRLSLISIVANVLILPLMPFTMFLIFTTATVGLVSIWLAQKISLLLWLVIGYILKVSVTLGTVPGIERGFRLNFLSLLACYIALIEIVIIINHRKANKNETT